MRSGLIRNLAGLLRRRGGRPSRRSGSPLSAPSSDTSDARFDAEYSPNVDGDPDPGEVVWTWVPYQEDLTQGKDRPVVVVGRRGDRLLGVALTSKDHPTEPQVVVGPGLWDSEGRVSYAKVGRLLEVDPRQVRREGAVLERRHFDDVVAGVRRAHHSV